MLNAERPINPLPETVATAMSSLQDTFVSIVSSMMIPKERRPTIAMDVASVVLEKGSVLTTTTAMGAVAASR